MAVFLFVMATVALLTGLLGLVAGYSPRKTGRPQAPPASVPAREQGATTGGHGRRDGRLIGGGQAL
jgi:hypothetical protein